MTKWMAGTALCAVLAGHAALAQSPYNTLTVFGDSLSDNGNIPKIVPIAILQTINAPGEIPLPPYYDFHFSNGPIYAEKLGPLLGITAPLTDFAVGGAFSAPLHETLGAVPLSGVNLNPLLSSLASPNALLAATLDTSLQGQIISALGSGSVPGRNGLTVVWGGANDYFAMFGAIEAQPALSTSQITGIVTQQVTTTVTNLAADVGLLAKAGARTFVVPTLPNLGATPAFNGNPLTAQLGNLTAASHDIALATVMGRLGQSLGVNIFLVDTAGLFNDVEAHPGKYGLSNVTTACLTAAGVCANPSGNLFWDSVHPTTGVQTIFAEAVASTIEAPWVIGAQGQLADIVSQSIFDGLSNRVAALQQGASGISLSGPGGAASHIGRDDPLSFYLTGGYGRGARDNRDSEAGFTYDSYSVRLGADYRADPNVAFGAQVGYTSASSTFKDALGKDDLRSYSVAVYGAVFGSHWVGSAAGFYAYQDWDKIDRNTLVEGEVAAATSAGTTIGGKIEGAYLWQAEGANFGPTADIRISRVSIDAYTEQGAVAINEAVDNQAFSSLIGELGGQLSTSFAGSGVTFHPTLRVGWDHQFSPGQRHVFSRLASLPQATIDTTLPSNAEDWARVGLGLTTDANDWLTVIADIDGSVGRADGQDVSFQLKMQCRF